MHVCASILTKIFKKNGYHLVCSKKICIFAVNYSLGNEEYFKTLDASGDSPEHRVVY